MEEPRVTLLTLLCVVFCSQQTIIEAEVKMRVRPGENVIIYSDCVSKPGYTPVWFKNSSHGRQPPFLIKSSDIADGAHLGYSFLLNPFNNTQDLLIKNVTKSDLGLYYCALMKRHAVNIYGSTSTRLILVEETPPPSRETCAPCTSENGSPGWSCSWQLLVSVSAVCVLLSSLFSSISVYYLCRKNLKAQFIAGHGGRDGRQTQRRDEGIETEVSYSLLDYQYIK